MRNVFCNVHIECCIRHAVHVVLIFDRCHTAIWFHLRVCFILQEKYETCTGEYTIHSTLLHRYFFWFNPFNDFIYIRFVALRFERDRILNKTFYTVLFANVLFLGIYMYFFIIRIELYNPLNLVMLLCFLFVFPQLSFRTKWPILYPFFLELPCCIKRFLQERKNESLNSQKYHINGLFF